MSSSSTPDNEMVLAVQLPGIPALNKPSTGGHPCAGKRVRAAAARVHVNSHQQLATQMLSGQHSTGRPLLKHRLKMNGYVQQ